MPKPTLLLCGGGPTSPALVRKLIQLAGGTEELLVVLAHAQREVGRGALLSAQMLQQEGARRVQAVSSLQPDEVIQSLREARGVWIPGGDQSLFMERLGHFPEFRRALQAVLGRGGVVGGTSAGASLMGAWMPVAEMREKALVPQAVPTAPGLSLLPSALVDQHLLARNRLQRFVGAVLQHPQLMGVGLDEGAWAVVEGGKNLKVFAGQVVLLRLTAPPRQRNGVFRVKDIQMQILTAGDEWELPQVVIRKEQTDVARVPTSWSI